MQGYTLVGPPFTCNTRERSWSGTLDEYPYRVASIPPTITVSYSIFRWSGGITPFSQNPISLKDPSVCFLTMNKSEFLYKLSLLQSRTPGSSVDTYVQDSLSRYFFWFTFTTCLLRMST